MTSKLQLGVCCLSCGGAIWWTLTKDTQGKACMVLFAGKTVRSLPERFVSMRAYSKALYKYHLPFLSSKQNLLYAWSRLLLGICPFNSITALKGTKNTDLSHQKSSSLDLLTVHPREPTSHLYPSSPAPAAVPIHKIASTVVHVLVYKRT